MPEEQSYQDMDKPIYDHDTHLPYANRSIKWIIGLLVALFLVGAFAVWFFFGFGGVQQNQSAQNAQDAGQTAQETVQSAGSETGQNAVFSFFKTMFAGMGEGIDESPTSLQTDKEIKEAVNVQLYLRRQEQQEVDASADGYRQSLMSVLGARIVDSNGAVIGELHDVIVNKKTGAGQLLILDEDDNPARRSLKDVDFKNVFVQNPQGQTVLSMKERQVKSGANFDYMQDDNQDDLISLRRLRAGQLLDYQGNITGQIDAVIYGNAEAQGLVIDLRPALEQYGMSSFYLDFADAQYIENPDGLDIKLTKAQTRALAQSLMRDDSQN